MNVARKDKDDYFYWLVTYQLYRAVFWKEKQIETNEFNTKFNFYALMQPMIFDKGYRYIKE